MGRVWLERVCCMELKTAVLVIGVFNLVAALFGVLGSGLGAATSGFGLAVVNGAFGNLTDWNATLHQNSDNLGPAEREQLNQVRDLLARFGQGSNDNDFNHPLSELGQGSSTEDDINVNDINQLLGFAFVMMIALLVICILYVILASLLIHGARKGKAGLLVPWVVLTVITFIYDCIQLIYTIINYINNPYYLGLNCGLIGCHMGIASYCIAIVWSFRQQLRRGDASASNEMRKM